MIVTKFNIGSTKIELNSKGENQRDGEYKKKGYKN